MKRGFLLLILCGIGWWFSPASVPNYKFHFDEPEQENFDGPNIIVQGVKLVEVAHYHVQAVVLSRENYKYDSLAKFIPMDLVLAWGPSSSAFVYKKLNISQGGRFYTWWASRETDLAPYTLENIKDSTANTHIIPFDAAIAEQCQTIHPYDVVTLDGFLVNAPSYGMVTSMVRTDSGPGACEIMLVTGVKIIPCPDKFKEFFGHTRQ